MAALRILLPFLALSSSLLHAQPVPPARPTQPQNANSPLPPTRTDILRGAYGPFRANNDLLYYHLDIRVDPDTYRVWADGELLTCEPAKVLPMAQRYFLF